ncbi:MAG: alanine racemase [Parcubacteria group bacterium]
MSQHRTWVEISKDALKNNTEVIKGLLNPETKLLAVVKANAYGHGLINTAKLLLEYGVDWLGIFSFKEALQLRDAGVSAPILVMGPTDPEDFKRAIDKDIDVSLAVSAKYAFEHIPPELKVHLKIDTGLSRQGFIWDKLDPIFEELRKYNINLEGVFTHLADAKAIGDTSYSDTQLERFKKAIETVESHGYKNLIRHMLAADGLITFPKAQFDMVRAGIALYGLPPSHEWEPKFEELGFKEVLSWKTTVTEVKDIDKDSYIGYDMTERVQRDTRTAVLPVGYWDGYDRLLSSKAHVVITGTRCKILGRVSMNLIIVDITDIKAKVEPGDTCILIGSEGDAQVTVTELAELANTISYEIVTRINPLLPRVYK